MSSPKLKIGQVYTNISGVKYICTDVYGKDARFTQIDSHWTFVAHSVRMYDDGRIDWWYSTGGHFND